MVYDEQLRSELRYPTWDSADRKYWQTCFIELFSLYNHIHLSHSLVAGRIHGAIVAATVAAIVAATIAPCIRPIRVFCKCTAQIIVMSHCAHIRYDLWVTCCKAQDGVRPSPKLEACSRSTSTTWIHQIQQNTGIPVTDDLELAEDRSFWWQIATVGCFGWSLCDLMMMTQMYCVDMC